MQATTTTSSYQANRLLQAWRHHDPDQMACELDSAASFCRAAAGDTAELERRELLEGIVQEIGRLAPGADSAAEALTYVDLLEHLSRHQAGLTAYSVLR